MKTISHDNNQKFNIISRLILFFWLNYDFACDFNKFEYFVKYS